MFGFILLKNWLEIPKIISSQNFESSALLNIWCVKSQQYGFKLANIEQKWKNGRILLIINSVFRKKYVFPISPKEDSKNDLQCLHNVHYWGIVAKV